MVCHEPEELCCRGGGVASGYGENDMGRGWKESIVVMSFLCSSRGRTMFCEGVAIIS